MNESKAEQNTGEKGEGTKAKQSRIQREKAGGRGLSGAESRRKRQVDKSQAERKAGEKGWRTRAKQSTKQRKKANSHTANRKQ